ncbi:MAG TPA: hypothetical protein VJX67_05725, partial [Blastocatellia bacterium]|nr:hypothetical protein [Blastocatellia bacterium]
RACNNILVAVMFSPSAILLCTAFAADGLQPNTAAVDGARFQPAYFHHVRAGAMLSLFPIAGGKATDVTLPAGLQNYNLISFGFDGECVYLQMPHPQLRNYADGLVKVEFRPTRLSPVPGTAGIGDVWSLTSSSASSRLFVSASGGPTHECGAYEVDPQAAAHRPLRVGRYPDCGGAVGPISPDGKKLLSRQGDRLYLLNIETGATQPLGKGSGSWSPDGRWIAVSGAKRTTLIDVKDLTRRRRLAASGVDDRLAWSPDSKRLLFAKRACLLADDFESLVVLDVESGAKHEVLSSHCAVSSSSVGWADPEVIR